MPDSIAFKYRAFLSYSHRDTAWAKWLHRALEGTRVDKDLVGRQTPVGPVPKTIGPIFRDREDFSAGHSLTEQTLAALQAAQFLIVLCSPQAARSVYVNEEIRRFKAMGRADRVIPVIIDGEPGDPERECFPPALRFKVGPDGTLTDEREEPIAADARPVGDGKEIAKQKVVAGVLGLGLDEIMRRAERARRRRHRFWAGLAGVFLFLAVVASASTVYAYQKVLESDERLDQAIEIAYGFVNEAAGMSDRFGVPAAVTLSLLGRAESALNGLIARGANTATLRYRKAAMLLMFAGSYESLGRTNDSLQRAVEGRDLLLELTEGNPKQREWQFSLGVAHFMVGAVRTVQRDLSGALDSYGAALGIGERLVIDDATNVDLQGGLLRVRVAMGDVFALQGSVANAAESYRHGLKHIEDLASARSVDMAKLVGRFPGLQPPVIEVVNRLAAMRMLQGHFDEALRYFQTILAAREMIAASDTDSIAPQIALQDSRSRIGDLLLHRDKFDEAMEHFRAGLAIADRLAAADPTNMLHRRNATMFRDRVGFTLLGQGRTADALAAFRANLAAAERLVAADPGNSVWQGYLAIGHERIGDALLAQNDLPEALAEYRQAQKILTPLIAGNGVDADWQRALATALFKSGEVLRRQDAGAPALESFRASLEISERLAAANPDIVLFQSDVLKARWRVAEGEVDRNERQASVLSALLPLQEANKLTAENERWFAAARQELPVTLSGNPPVSEAPASPDTPSADTLPPR